MKRGGGREGECTFLLGETQAYLQFPPELPSPQDQVHHLKCEKSGPRGQGEGIDPKKCTFLLGETWRYLQFLTNFPWVPWDPPKRGPFQGSLKITQFSGKSANLKLWSKKGQKVGGYFFSAGGFLVFFCGFYIKYLFQSPERLNKYFICNVVEKRSYTGQRSGGGLKKGQKWPPFWDPQNHG